MFYEKNYDFMIDECPGGFKCVVVYLLNGDPGVGHFETVGQTKTYKTKEEVWKEAEAIVASHKDRVAI